MNFLNKMKKKNEIKLTFHSSITSDYSNLDNKYSMRFTTATRLLKTHFFVRDLFMKAVDTDSNSIHRFDGCFIVSVHAFHKTRASTKYQNICKQKFIHLCFCISSKFRSRYHCLLLLYCYLL